MQDNVRNITTVKERYNLKIKREKGITLVALVITIVVLIILAGIAISMTVGENGIFTKAKEAKRLQVTAEAKEKIGTDILDAQIEATQKDEQLQQSKVEEIIAKYGELQADGDTIKLKDNGYEISLKEIYNGSTSGSGGSTGGSTGSAELDSLKAELAQTNATEDKILKDYKAYSNGKLMTGTMENYTGQTQEVTSTSDDTYTYLSIPNAGYYGTDSKLKTLNSNLGAYFETDWIKNTTTNEQSCDVGFVPREVILITTDNKAYGGTEIRNYETKVKLFASGYTTTPAANVNTKWSDITTPIHNLEASQNINFKIGSTSYYYKIIALK